MHFLTLLLQNHRGVIGLYFATEFGIFGQKHISYLGCIYIGLHADERWCVTDFRQGDEAAHGGGSHEQGRGCGCDCVSGGDRGRSWVSEKTCGIFLLGRKPNLSFVGWAINFFFKIYTISFENRVKVPKKKWEQSHDILDISVWNGVFL
jgi:hypothetical protein